MTDSTRLPRTYFVPSGHGARVHLRGCSFFMTASDIAGFVDWLLADRPDPMPERRAVLADRASQRPWEDEE